MVEQYIWPITVLVIFGGMLTVVLYALRIAHDLAKIVLQSGAPLPKLLPAPITIPAQIVPTAHPATPFGGRGSSGWGSTQGLEGLLEMTVPQVVNERSGAFRPHAESGSSAAVPRGYLRLVHGRGFRERWRGFRQLISGLRAGPRAGARRGEG